MTLLSLQRLRMPICEGMKDGAATVPYQTMRGTESTGKSKEGEAILINPKKNFAKKAQKSCPTGFMSQANTNQLNAFRPAFEVLNQS